MFHYTNILMPYGFAALRMLASDFILPKQNSPYIILWPRVTANWTRASSRTGLSVPASIPFVRSNWGPTSQWHTKSCLVKRG